MGSRPRGSLLAAGVGILLSMLVGCAQMGLEYAPKGPYLGYHKELPAAERAVEAARAAGKDRECPDEFKAAEKLMNDAYETYWACRTKEAIAMANDATNRANALCPQRVQAPAPAPKPAAPTVTFTANPGTVQAGACTTLTWSSTNATGATIDNGVGAVPPSGSREVCPKSTVGYGITARGPGGSVTEAAVVIVTPLPVAAAPTVTLSANPGTVLAGKCSTLTWSSTNATGATIDQGVGTVPPSGSREVCPTGSMGYMITARGPGGAGTATTVVLVTPAPAPRAEWLTLHINFDSNKATIRPADIPELRKAVEFVKRYPDRKISIEGHTDSRGDAKYNQSLSEKRAAAVKEYLLKNGVTGGERIGTVGHGESKPVADNASASGRFLNRRVEVVVQP